MWLHNLIGHQKSNQQYIIKRKINSAKLKQYGMSLTICQASGAGHRQKHLTLWVKTQEHDKTHLNK